MLRSYPTGREEKFDDVKRLGRFGNNHIKEDHAGMPVEVLWEVQAEQYQQYKNSFYKKNSCSLLNADQVKYKNLLNLKRWKIEF